jgi:hypothetical protein
MSLVVFVKKDQAHFYLSVAQSDKNMPAGNILGFMTFIQMLWSNKQAANDRKGLVLAQFHQFLRKEFDLQTFRR